MLPVVALQGGLLQSLFDSLNFGLCKAHHAQQIPKGGGLKAHGHVVKTEGYHPGFLTVID